MQLVYFSVFDIFFLKFVERNVCTLLKSKFIRMNIFFSKSQILRKSFELPRTSLNAHKYQSFDTRSHPLTCNTQWKLQIKQTIFDCEMKKEKKSKAESSS